MEEAVIRTEGLSRDYAGAVGLEDADLEVGPGRVVALLGPNGAGKTTLLKLLLGVLEPSRGEAWLFKARTLEPELAWTDQTPGELILAQVQAMEIPADRVSQYRHS